MNYNAYLMLKGVWVELLHTTELDHRNVLNPVTLNVDPVEV
jgi:hypothetical protein